MVGVPLCFDGESMSMRLCFKAPELQDKFSGSFFILDIKLSTSPVPNLPGCYHASCHHNNGLNT